MEQSMRAGSHATHALLVPLASRKKPWMHSHASTEVAPATEEVEEGRTSLHWGQEAAPVMVSMLWKRVAWQMHWLRLVDPAAAVVDPSGQLGQVAVPVVASRLR